jgi:thioredoxin-like negative regulator of GroEL
MDPAQEKILADQSKRRRTLTERVRRGACLLNAAKYDEAIAELEIGAGAAAGSDPLGCYLTDILRETNGIAASTFTIAELRQGIAADPENPAIHFQLGALLVEAGRLEEAELRFTQVLSISRDHVESLVCLGLVAQLRGEVRQGISLLQRAQGLRPDDPKIALLLAHAAKSGEQQGAAIDLCAVVTND